VIEQGRAQGRAQGRLQGKISIVFQIVEQIGLAAKDFVKKQAEEFGDVNIFFSILWSKLSNDGYSEKSIIELLGLTADDVNAIRTVRQNINLDEYLDNLNE
jgi:hypothetical protein